jgi:hypothetical protein
VKSIETFGCLPGTNQLKIINMKAKYFGVIFCDSHGNTQHVNVYRSWGEAVKDATENNGYLECGIRRIVNRCNWWGEKDTANYKRRWILDNVL